MEKRRLNSNYLLILKFWRSSRHIGPNQFPVGQSDESLLCPFQLLKLVLPLIRLPFIQVGFFSQNIYIKILEKQAIWMMQHKGWVKLGGQNSKRSPNLKIRKSKNIHMTGDEKVLKMKNWPIYIKAWITLPWWLNCMVKVKLGLDFVSKCFFIIPMKKYLD